jgi:hypothetical protein
MRLPLLAASVAASVACTLLVSLTTSAVATQAVPAPGLRFNFDSPTTGNFTSATVKNVGTLGTTGVKTRVILKNGATLPGQLHTGHRRAARFPRFDAADTGRRAGISVVDTEGVDDLSPGTAPFRFGADIRLDAGATALANSYDDGDNVIQRGLAGSPLRFPARGDQYKLEVDRRVPACTIAGETTPGSSSSYRISIEGVTGFPRTGIGSGWYRIRCARQDATTLRLTVWTMNADGTLGPSYTKTRTDIPATLDITMNSRATPLAVGAKFADAKTIHPPSASSDQFNGAIDNAYFGRR